MEDKDKNEKTEGAFVTSLKRNNKQIKGDRAEMISEDTQLEYRRTVEDLERDIKHLERRRAAMLDLSGENALSLTPAKDFDSTEFVREDMKLGIQLREMNIRLEIAKSRYEYLFEGE